MLAKINNLACARGHCTMDHVLFPGRFDAPSLFRSFWIMWHALFYFSGDCHTDLQASLEKTGATASTNLATTTNTEVSRKRAVVIVSPFQNINRRR